MMMMYVLRGWCNISGRLGGLLFNQVSSAALISGCRALHWRWVASGCETKTRHWVCQKIKITKETRPRFSTSCVFVFIPFFSAIESRATLCVVAWGSLFEFLQWRHWCKWDITVIGYIRSCFCGTRALLESRKSQRQPCRVSESLLVSVANMFW